MSQTVSQTKTITVEAEVITLQGGPSGWEAVLPEWTVTGIGATEKQAIADAIASLGGYLALSLNKDGLSVEQAMRPIPRSWRVRLRGRLLVGKIQRVLHRSSTATRSRVSVAPPSAAASC